MKNIRLTFICLMSLAYALLWGINAHAKDYEVVEEHDFAKDLIGNSFNFSEDIVYVDLSVQSGDAINRNGGIKLALTRERIAKINNKLKKEPVSRSMAFRLIKVLKTVHTNLDDWDKGAREAYLNFAKITPDVDMLYVLEDSNGIISTVMPGTFRRAVIIVDANKSLNSTPKNGAN